MHLVFILEFQFPPKVKWFDTKNIKRKSIMIHNCLFYCLYTCSMADCWALYNTDLLGLFKFWHNHVCFTFSPALDYVLKKYCDRNKLYVELSTKISVLKSQNPLKVVALPSKWNGKRLSVFIMLSLCGPNASA